METTTLYAIEYIKNNVTRIHIYLWPKEYLPSVNRMITKDNGIITNIIPIHAKDVVLDRILATGMPLIILN